MFIDVAPYTRSIQLNVPGSLSLAKAVVAAAPASSPPAVQKTLARVVTHADRTSLLWKDEEVTHDVRPFDRAEDNGMGAILGRLAPYESLDVSKYPQAVVAAKLRGLLFPNGLSFLTLPYKEEWAECEKRFEQIKTEGLGADLKALVGAEFVESAEYAHAEYGRTLGITTKSTEKDAAALQEPLRELSRALSDYALQLAAAVAAEDNEEAAKVLLAGLAPIDEAREWKKKRRAKSDKGDGVDPAPAPTPDKPLA